MTHNPDARSSDAFRLRRRTHANLEALQDAMIRGGVKSVMLTATGGHDHGRGLIAQDMDWQYSREPELVTAEEVRRMDEDGILPEPVSIRCAAQACARDMLDTLEGSSWVVNTSMRKVRIPVTGPAEIGGEIDADGDQARIGHWIGPRDPMEGFLDRAPVLQTARGDWYEINDLDTAQAATALGYTAVAHFFDPEQNVGPAERAENTRWFTLIEHDGGDSRALVTMAAQSRESFDADLWPHASHVTGYRNYNAYRAYEEEISALTELCDLSVAPNHMGQPLDEPDEGMEP